MYREISQFIDKKLYDINLRDCILFMNAFNKKFGKDEFSELFPEATEEEIRDYDNKIIELMPQKIKNTNES